MRRVTIIKVVVFCLIVVVALGYLSRVLVNNMPTMNGFYAQEEDSLDGIYVGSSAAMNFWMAPVAYNEYGMAIYNLGSPVQPLALEKNLIKEALKSQPNIDVVIIELKNIARDTPNNNADVEGFIRTITDPMYLSLNKKDAIDDTLEYYEKKGTDINYNKLTYYFPLIQRHSNWAEAFTMDNLLLKQIEKPYKGFSTSKGYKTDSLKEPEYYTGYTELKAADKNMIKELLDYCETLTQEVIFVCAPISADKERYGKLNSAIRMCENAGFETLNFNTKELGDKLNLDWNSDFSDNAHVNLSGAVKYTEFFSEYLDQNYEIEDHRGEKSYESWDEAYKALMTDINKRKKN